MRILQFPLLPIIMKRADTILGLQAVAGRSTFGFVVFNLHNMKETSIPGDPLDCAPNSSSTKTIKVNGLETVVVDVAPLTRKLKKHFLYDKIEGAFMENEGDNVSRNSHFERRIFFN